MPYRINPRNRREVQVKKGVKWATLKIHPTEESAKKHLTALRINVKK